MSCPWPRHCFRSMSVFNFSNLWWMFVHVERIWPCPSLLTFTFVVWTMWRFRDDWFKYRKTVRNNYLMSIQNPKYAWLLIIVRACCSNFLSNFRVQSANHYTLEPHPNFKSGPLVIWNWLPEKDQTQQSLPFPKLTSIIIRQCANMPISPSNTHTHTQTHCCVTASSRRLKHSILQKVT